VSTVHQTADQREAHLTFSLSFLGRFFLRRFDGADRRPAGGTQGCHPEFSNHRLALLLPALFVERLLGCQLGVLNGKRVLPSRTRTETSLFAATSSLANLSVDHVTIWRWVQRYALVLNQRIRREMRHPKRSSRVDQT